MTLFALPLGDVINSLWQAITLKHPEYRNERRIRKKIREEFSAIVSNQVSFGKNADMLEYLKSEAITTELTHKSRNFIILDQEVSEDTFEILGFFTLTLKIVNVKDLDDDSRKAFVLSGKNANHLDYIPGLLIAQFGKNLHFNKITGQ